jgi:hypothetical protein
LIDAVWKYAVASLAAGLVTTGIVRGFALPSVPASAGAALQRIIVISAMFITLYLGIVILLYKGCAPLRQLVSLLLELAPASRISALRPATKES